MAVFELWGAGALTAGMMVPSAVLVVLVLVVLGPWGDDADGGDGGDGIDGSDSSNGTDGLGGHCLVDDGRGSGYIDASWRVMVVMREGWVGGWSLEPGAKVCCWLRAPLPGSARAARQDPGPRGLGSTKPRHSHCPATDRTDDGRHKLDG